MTCQNVSVPQVQNSQNTQNSQYIRGFLKGTAITGAVIVSAVAINSFIFSGTPVILSIPCEPAKTTADLILNTIKKEFPILDTIIDQSVIGATNGAMVGIPFGTFLIGDRLPTYKAPSICRKIFAVAKIMTLSTTVASAIGAVLLIGVNRLPI